VSNQETEYRAYCADREAQLVRLRSQVTRISQSYEALKDKRYTQQHAKGTKSAATTQVMELEQKLERTEQELEQTREELKKTLKKVVKLEAEKADWEVGADSKSKEGKQVVLVKDHKDKQFAVYWGGHGNSERPNNEGTERMLKEVDSIVKKKITEADNCELASFTYTPGLETSELLTRILDKHFKQLNDDLLNIMLES